MPRVAFTARIQPNPNRCRRYRCIAASCHDASGPWGLSRLIRHFRHSVIDEHHCPSADVLVHLLHTFDNHHPSHNRKRLHCAAPRPPFSEITTNGTPIAPRKPSRTITAVTSSLASRLAGLGPPHGTSPPRDIYVLAVVLAYGLSSLGGVFVNKACLSAFNFGYTVTLMLSQLCVSVLALSILRLFGVVNIPRRSFRQLIVLVFPAVFFIANVTVGLLALKLVNIPMFSAFRRLSVLSVMVLEWLVLGKTASQRILITVFVMVLGSFLAGLGDLAFDPVGYCLVFLNNFITAANLVSIKKATAIASLDALGLFYYVSLISLPIVFTLALLSGELRLALHEIITQPDLQTLSFALALSLSAGSAFLINFFTNMCTQLTSPLTTAITGQMKNVLQTVLGIFAFGYRVTALNLFGLAVALTGSLMFARYKYIDAQAAKLENILPGAKQIPVAVSQSAPAVFPDERIAIGGFSSSEDEKSSLLRQTARHISPKKARSSPTNHNPSPGTNSIPYPYFVR